MIAAQLIKHLMPGDMMKSEADHKNYFNLLYLNLMASRSSTI